MESPQITNEGLLALQAQLQSAGIDTSKWGTGQAKTLAHLKKEIDEGETVLITNERGELLRKVVVGGTDVYYVSPDGKKYRLKEEKQVFNDGRQRTRDLGKSVLEKMKPDENPRSAMMRGVSEELGLEGEINLTEIGTHEELFMSPSYPGLQSQSVRHNFEVTLADTQYRPEGYVEEQADKKTYFVWEEVKSENCIMDPQGALWREREPKLIEGYSHIIALRGAGSVNGISVADAERMLNEQLFPRVREMLKDKGKVAFIFDGDDDNRAYPDIGYIIGRIRDEFDSTNTKFLAVQKNDWWSGDGKPIHNANSKEYETYVIDAKSPPENTGGLPYTGQQGTEHNALSQSITLVNSGKYTQWYVGAVGPIAEQQISDLDMKSNKGINVIVFKTPVSTEQAINLQSKIDAVQKWLDETDAMGANVPEDRKSQIPKEREKLARLLSSKERRTANPYGAFFDKEGKDKGLFKELAKMKVEVIEV